MLRTTEPHLTSRRIKAMYFCRVFGLTLLVASALAQDAPSPAASRVPADQAAPALPPPIDLKPDASGTVPQDQIRELLRRVTEKDLENEKRLRDYTYIQREEEH